MSDQGWTRVPNGLVRSKTLSAAAKVVYLALASRAGITMQCWPSLPTIAEESGVSTSSVKRALAELRAAGWLTWETRLGDDGRTKISNLYTLASTPTTHGSEGTYPTGQGDPTLGSQGTDPRVTLSHPTGQGDPRRRTIEEEPSKKRASRAVDVDDRFDEFWKAYPKRQSKKPAQAAWTKALKTTDADTIIAAAHRFAETRATEIAAGRSEARFTAYPATWLNQERWTDEPDKPNLTLVSGGYEYDQWRTR